MIAVIADDFTGAAELGGIGLRYRLRTEINTTVNTATDADLLVIAADTRSMGQAAAMGDMRNIALQLKALRPEWIFKKTDSVLRGHVVPEINALLDVLGWPVALLVPANPSLGRTIKEGRYFFNGLPIDQSSFADDPEFPITSSHLRDMLRAPVAVRKVKDALPAEGIIVGEVQDAADLDSWAGRIGPNMLLAGASGFFSAVLGAKGASGRFSVVPYPVGGKTLFVSGTTFDKSRTAIRELHRSGGPVSYMPPAGQWSEEIIGLIRDRGRAVIAIEGMAERSALQLRTDMAATVSQVLKQVKIDELIIEGGSTAYAILQEAGLHTFFPEEELAPGVIRMRAPEAPGLYITVKPGSYRWPGSIKL
jgi:D-threonate/D-erythronate kinase